jgi:hypothetical protein
VSRQEGRALVTLDAGFADIRAYPPREHAGVIVFRLRHQDARQIRDTAIRVLSLIGEHPLARTLWIVDEKRVRFRT